MAAATKNKKTAPEASAKAATSQPSERQNAIPKTSLTSSVTSDLPGAPEDPQAQKEAFDALTPAEKASIGLIKVDGIDFRYVGIAPARDKDATTEGGLNITPQNSTFRPLADVPFSNSIRVKDPKSGTFYFPPDGCTSWDGCNLDGSYLIPRK